MRPHALLFGFRSEFAAASLKHALLQPFHRNDSRFRSEFAAASLKRRGLLQGIRIKPRFRSEFAAASLKLKVCVRYFSHVHWFPQRIRCGLIEAAHGIVCITKRLSFRSEFAAASLKPVSRYLASKPKDGFRSEFAAASLKPHRAIR